MPDALYDEDFYLWTQEQARALRDAARAGVNLPVDWENIAEEIESLGSVRRNELRSRLRTIIEHLLKLSYSPASEPRSGWRETIRRSRVDIEDVVRESPSLDRELLELAEQAHRGAFRIAVEGMKDHGETEAVRCKLAEDNFSLNQILGDWFPPEPDA